MNLASEMISPEMKKLAEAIQANGEAIRTFREQYIPALRSTQSASNERASSAASGSSSTANSCPAEHAQLIRGIMDNMDQIRTLASGAERRIALPVATDSDIDFNVRNCSVLGDLNELPQGRILTALRSQTEEVDLLVRSVEDSENLLRNCS
ncbi:uncharacterized protein LOC100902859 [Galendromus occidentalis]|uniref:Uncharacterized protein LOC100902859 n=1 Tax=Galendromus occidentalis TaxID=34638 RepID=A0AAJ7L644_9ACAR|nr:uncharacterized protein LOC100902859 [Galendromus occidentalis]